MPNNVSPVSCCHYLAFHCRAFSAEAQSQSRGSSIESKFATVEGTRIHYLTAGHGSAVILLHGYDLQGTGHWLMEERPRETMDALVAFL